MSRIYRQTARRLQKSKDEIEEFFNLSFTSNRKKRNLVFDVYIVVILFPLLPIDIYGAMLGSDRYVVLGGRMDADRKYLVSSGLQDFSVIYMNGVTFQLLVTITSALIISMLYIRATPNLYFPRKSTSLIFGFLIVSISAFFGFYLLFFMNDFGFHSNNSWFQDNLSAETRLTPQPANRLVFVTTAGAFLLILFFVSWLIPLILSFAFGRTAKLREGGD